MVCFGEFLEEFKKTLGKPYDKNVFNRTYFCVEFRNADKTIREADWYSRLRVVGFKPDKTLLYTRDFESDQPRHLDPSRESMPFKYTTNWDIVEILEPDTTRKMIIRIQRSRR